jgi:hypothetical protein
MDKFDKILLGLLGEAMGKEDVSPYEKRWDMAASRKDSTYREALAELASPRYVPKYGPYWQNLLNRYKKQEIGRRIRKQIRWCMWQELGNYIPIKEYPEEKASCVLKNLGCRFVRRKGALGWYKEEKYIAKNRYEVLKKLGFEFCRVYINPATNKFTLLPGKPGQNYTSDGGSPPR